MIAVVAIGGWLAWRILNRPVDPSRATREWLERGDLNSKLDLGDMRLSAPNANRQLMTYRGSEYRQVSDANELAALLKSVRGEADGKRFWRLVEDYDLWPKPPAPAPAAVRSPPTYALCDPGICPEDEHRTRKAFGTTWPASPTKVRISRPFHLDGDPELVESGPGSLRQRVRLKPERGSTRGGIEARLAAGALEIEDAENLLGLAEEK